MINNLNPEEAHEYRIYMATVVDDNDPEKFQRIRVTVPGLLDGANDVLPWVLPIQSSLFGTGQSHGVMGVPPIGSTVLVHFQGNDMLYGMQVGNPSIKNSDLGPLTENYPKRYGFRDPIGNHFYIDTTPGQTTVNFTHISGMMIDVTNTGTINVHTPDHLNIRVVKNATVQIDGNAKIGVNGNTEVQVGGNLTAGVQGSVTAQVNGSGSLSFGGNVQSQAPTWIHSGDVAINGTLNVSSNVTAGAGVAVAGNLTAARITDTTQGIGLHTHQHGGVDTGGGVTSPPVIG